MKVCIYLLRLKNHILNILFPIKCFNCKAINEVFCPNCIFNTNKVQEFINENMIAVFDYKDPVIKKAIWQLKYYHKTFLGKQLGRLLYEFLIEDISDIRLMSPGQKIFVIPIPISKRKRKKRGYNQSEIIAKGFCSCAPENVFELRNDIVYKTIDNIPQAKISDREKRLKNIKGVFEVRNSKIVKNKLIIIIDDVITTGATMNEIMKVLKRAGAKKVIGMALAH